MRVLVVREPFGAYGVGDMIKDPAEIAAVGETDNAARCIATNVEESFFLGEDEPKPAKGR